YQLQGSFGRIGIGVGLAGDRDRAVHRCDDAISGVGLTRRAAGWSTTWLRSRRFDLWLQLGALAGIAPALAIYASLDGAHASSFLSLASLIAVPFLHVFGSFFFAFSTERNRSVSPRRLAAQWALWAAAALGLQVLA